MLPRDMLVKSMVDVEEPQVEGVSVVDFEVLTGINAISWELTRGWESRISSW